MNNQIQVLIIEDSEDDAILLKRELRKGGFYPRIKRVDCAQDVEEALDTACWDLIITDHNMPRFNVAEALKIVKSRNLDVPVIIVSGSIGEETAVEAMKAGAHDYIMKDNLARLIPAIQRELSEAQNRLAHRMAEKAIHHMAYHDSLTGLVNRAEFDRRVEAALKTARERNIVHSIMYLDLDQFKIINDTCGHIAGDDLLRQLSAIFQQQIRENDALARLGGDEFGVLLESCPVENARAVARNILKVVRNFRFIWMNKLFSIGVSIGVTSITSANDNVQDVLSKADLACYAAKDLGRNRIHVYNNTDMDVSRRQREMQWISRLNQAIEHDKFVLFWQSIKPLTTADVTHRELLLRMVDDCGEIIPPGAFIPAAERYNLMPVLDRWVIHHAFQMLSRSGRLEPQIGSRDMFFINLSGNSLSDEGLAAYIKKELRRSAVPPQMICFEITETAAITNLKSALCFIRDIKNEGCKLALDDFGSGLSSFSYLKNLPMDYLKIDGGFVANMLNDPMDYEIVRAINRIGHVAHLETIAESVEIESVQKELRHIGVDYAQGYCIDAPSPMV